MAMISNTLILLANISVLVWVAPLLAKPSDQTPPMALKAWLTEDSGKSMRLHSNVTLATSHNNKPSIRMVQAFVNDDGAIEFYTHSNTQKVIHQKNNPQVAMHFWLSNTAKQVSIEGIVKPLNANRLDGIWQAMPRWMQINFMASDHKSVMPNEHYLKEKIAELEQMLDQNIPRPKEFIGYAMQPRQYIFYSVKRPEPAKKYQATLRNQQWVWQQLQP